MAARPHVNLHRLRISEPGRYYDSDQSIVMRKGLRLEEERRYLWHEIVHSDRRDRFGHTDVWVERAVEREAANRAMPWPSIAWAWGRSSDLTEMSGLLKVPEDWVHYRLMGLPSTAKALLRVRAEQFA